MHQEHGISGYEMSSSPMVLVSGNTMKLYSTGTTIINWNILCVVIKMSSSGSVYRLNSRSKLSLKFKICHEESAVFTYLGLQIEQLPTETHALQSSYINGRRPITIQKGRNKMTMKATNLGLSRDNLIR